VGLFFSIFFLIVVVYIFISLAYCFFSTDKYIENLQMLRRLFYAIFVVGVGFGLVLEEIDFEDWQKLLELTALFVFIDLSIFQTPDILKIWSTEFRQDNYIRKIIKKNEEIISYNSKKVECFTEIVINKSSNYLNNLIIPFQFEDYKEDLKTYLEYYTETFQIKVSIFEFDDTELGVNQALNRIEQCYNKTIEDAEWREKLIQEILDGNTIELKNKKEIISSGIQDDKKVFVITFYGKDYKILMGISSNFIEVDGIDASHILSLTQIFDWNMD